MSHDHEGQNPHPLTLKEAEDFIAQFQRNITQAANVQEIDKQADDFFTGFVPISWKWLENNLKGISPTGKELIRQYWERMPEEAENESGIEEEMEQDIILRAELLMQAEERERQAIFQLMASLHMTRMIGGSLKDLAPRLFRPEN